MWAPIILKKGMKKLLKSLMITFENFLRWLGGILILLFTWVKFDKQNQISFQRTSVRNLGPFFTILTFNQYVPLTLSFISTLSHSTGQFLSCQTKNNSYFLYAEAEVISNKNIQRCWIDMDHIISLLLLVLWDGFWS